MYMLNSNRLLFEMATMSKSSEMTAAKIEAAKRHFQQRNASPKMLNQE